jgi:hypothetical protein
MVYSAWSKRGVKDWQQNLNIANLRDREQQDEADEILKQKRRMPMWKVFENKIYPGKKLREGSAKDSIRIRQKRVCRCACCEGERVPPRGMKLIFHCF